MTRQKDRLDAPLLAEQRIPVDLNRSPPSASANADDPVDIAIGAPHHYVSPGRSIGEKSAMSFLPRLRVGRDQKTRALKQQTEALEQRVSTLQAALKQCAEVAGRWTKFRRELTAAGAVLMLALGFALGVYRESIGQSVTDLAQGIGLVSPAGNNDDPEAAYQNHQYATALRLARPLAANGDARAQSVLGLLYYGGHGVQQDDNEAVKWFRQAAKQGHPVAQLYLGRMYSAGQGVPQDYAEAAKWYGLAADQGDAQAQYDLGVSFASGEVGNTDNVSAYMWFDLAAAHYPVSDTRHDTAVTSRETLKSKMTPNEIAEAQKRAREWKPK